MMNLYKLSEYLEDIQYVAGLKLDWEKLRNKSIVITGASGLIGSFLVDVLLEVESRLKLNCQIYALGRNEAKAKNRFSEIWKRPEFQFVACDVNKSLDYVPAADYILHLASNTHPVAYATDPVGTITTNIIGLYNMLNLAVKKKTIRFVFASSNEIYGENRGDVEKFDEQYCGYIDCNTMRAGYPESKRCGEALCQAYLKQKGLDIVIPRLTRSYGPTLLDSDTKALSQFLHKGIARENIILKSTGTQYFSYTYVADAVSGLLTVLLAGIRGEAYNIADEKSDIMLKDLAKIIADIAGTNVIFDLPDEVEAAGFSKATKARLDSTKLQALGWRAHYDMKCGLKKTMKILAKLEK